LHSTQPRRFNKLLDSINEDGTELAESSRDPAMRHDNEKKNGNFTTIERIPSAKVRGAHDESNDREFSSGDEISDYGDDRRIIRP
jgi:hypothetical protein